MAALIHREKARGFTLLELLVVIAIIAVLAAFSTAAWQRSGRTAHAVKCMHNLRQLGAALVKNIGEHDGSFPTLELAREKIADPVQTIDVALKPYLTDMSVFRCPADARDLWKTSGTSYLWNWKLNGQKLAAVRIAFVSNTASIISQ